MGSISDDYRQNLGSLRFYAADGRATADMSHGSFKHRDRIRGRRQLKLSDIQDTESGLSFSLQDPLTGRVCSGSLERAAAKDPSLSLYALRIDMAQLGINRLRIVMPSVRGEHFFGCGETFSHLDLKGKLARIWTAEHQNTRIIAGKLAREKISGPLPDYILPFEHYESYYSQPTFVSDRRYFVHMDGSSYMEIDFRQHDRTAITVHGESALYLGAADSYEALSSGITQLTGIQPRMPDRYIEGITLASQKGIGHAERLIGLSEEYGIPLTALWCQDWCGCRVTSFGYQVMWDWKYDESIYPGLPQKIAEWKSRGIAFLGYINPFMAVDGDVYKEASAKGWCVKDKSGNDYNVTTTTFPAAMIDLTNPDAYEWYKDIIKREMIGIGMGGWMADFGEYLPADAVLHNGRSGMEMHNSWPVIWDRLNREAIDECGRAGELFFFIRAGHSNSVRYANMVWNGDQHVDWSRDQGIGSVITAALSLSMSGVGLSHSDAGGYTSISHIRRSPELLMRWLELSCFSPMMRTHEGNRPDSNVQVDASKQLLMQTSRMANIHRLLKPYLDAQLEDYYKKGVPVMRPLFYHYDDSSIIDIEDEYLLGRDILVCPVLKRGARKRKCVLPADEWLHIFSGRDYSGGIFEVEAPVGTPPVFIRKSSSFAHALIEAVQPL